MLLKSVEISGFKSFAKKGFLEFRTPISAIVGPNGSGKSNVAESFRFVLGEQSVKSMRGKKGEDLIFNGSSTSSRMNRANVKVVFDNKNRFLDLDFDEVVIERVVHRDGANEYFVNGSKVRLKDVMEILSKANIGASGHHIISQGEADRILNVNNRERKVFLEEALGLKIYHFKISEAQRKLIKTNENLKEISSIKREIAPHLKFLTKQMEDIQKAKEVKEELVEKYKKYFWIEERYIKKGLEESLKEKNNLEAKMSSLKEILSEKERLVSTSNQNEQGGGFKIKLDEISISLKSLRDQKDTLLQELGKIKGLIEYENKRIKELESSNDIQIESIPANFVRALTSQIEEAVSKGLIDGIKNLISNFWKDLEGEKIKIDYSSFENFKKEQNIILNKLEEIKLKESELFQKQQNIRGEIDKLSKESNEANIEILHIKSDINDLILQINKNDNLIENIREAEEDFKEELQEAYVLVGRDSTDFHNILVVEDADADNRQIQNERRKEIERLKLRLESMGGANSDEVVKEFNEVKERDEFLTKEVDDLKNTIISLESLIFDLEEKLSLEFSEGVSKINSKFNNFFTLMFGGGRASINLTKEKVKGEDDEEKTEDGIDIDVSLPNKKVKGLQMLSGGERSLTSIALIFAMSAINPPPFIILDETDAALDEANSRKYGDMIESLSKYSQLILITHNRETMSRAGVLYGVTMSGDGISKLLSIELEEAVRVAK